MTTTTKPLLMGASMGLMMLWMVHGQLTGETSLSGIALVTFVGAHILFAATIIGAGLVVTRLSPAARQWLRNLRRPSLRHLGIMLLGATLSAGAVHIWIHGLI
ncbi:hypothetical protein SLH49_07770 [Cognatiyoonia sp. IB215446]|uniref:hypothetical protein n=1 Tax=Cognatiyoonia sp. IB215446 TaxID=3097355 RepID=UPI002A164A4E|nr:hypothetical protein [Cognatiyoonia sp. IB215446]MDX8347880.1 hypothetical protein [Cognatiyoonia sp. IB215446]